jgi:hypothetical protein
MAHQGSGNPTPSLTVSPIASVGPTRARPASSIPRAPATKLAPTTLITARRRNDGTGELL